MSDTNHEPMDETPWYLIPRPPVEQNNNTAPEETSEITFYAGRAAINATANAFYFDSQKVALPPYAFSVMLALGQRAGSIILTRDLVTIVWGESEANARKGMRSLSSNVQRIREVTEPGLIINKPGFGYMTPR